MICFINYIFTGLEHEKKDKGNEMLSSSCTGLGFISKNGKYNLEKNMLNGSYLKNLILQ